jgi:hypothetical protein
VNGDFGRSPFCGQLSGKLLLASTWPCIGTEIKAQGRVDNLIRGCVVMAVAPWEGSICSARNTHNLSKDQR